MYNRVKRYDYAIVDCKSALELNKDFHDIWWPLGNAYYYKKDYNNAFIAYTNYQKNIDKASDFMKKES